MGKSLNSLLSEMNEENISDNSHAVSKLVKCSNCGKTIPVPGYQTDVICQNCKTREDVNNDIITSSYHLQRDKIRVRRKRDQVIPAIHNVDHFDKTVDET